MSLVCANACTLPDDEPLYPIGSDLFHAVITRPAKLYGYFGPESSESEPCGPVTRGTCPRCEASTLESGKRCAWCEEPLA